MLSHCYGNVTYTPPAILAQPTEKFPLISKGCDCATVWVCFLFFGSLTCERMCLWGKTYSITIWHLLGNSMYGDRRRNERGTLSPFLFSTAGLKSFSVMRHNHHGRLHRALQRLYTNSAGIFGGFFWVTLIFEKGCLAVQFLLGQLMFYVNCRFDQKERITKTRWCMHAMKIPMLKTIFMKEK